MWQDLFKYIYTERLMMDLKLDMEEYLPLREVVFRTLRNAIVRGELAPGERLLEVTLARRLGVSRTPIREAIRMLELEGFVVMVPRKGAEVARITVNDLIDALEVRAALEELAAGLACQRIDEDGRQALKSACDDFTKAVKSRVVPDIVDADVAFHNVVMEITHNRKLINTSQGLREQVYRYRVEYVKDFSCHDKLVSEHQELTEAILKGDADKAKAVTRKHIYDQEKIVISNVVKKQADVRV